MKTCPKCNKELEEGTKFCDACGTQIFETVFCPNCGEQTSSEFAFCQKCGAPIAEDANIAAVTAESSKESKNILKMLPKKTIMFAGIGAIALVVIILVISVFSGGSGNNNYGLYIKDGEIAYTDFSEEGSLEITSRLFDGNRIVSSEMAYVASEVGNYIAFSDDGNRIFFPDKIGDSDGITLYYRDINKPDEEAVKIDSDVSMYAINNDGTKVAYVKGADGILYLHDLTDKEKIASGVVSFNVTEDLKKISYRNDKDSYYLWYADKDTVKLASDITSIEYVSSDLSKVYYVKDGSLYKQVEGNEDKEKIASDVSRVVYIYESGEVYYTKAESTEKNLLDYVDDDLLDSDAALTEPAYPTYPTAPSYPSWWQYNTDAEYNAAKAQYENDYAAYQVTCDQIRAEYDAAYEAYWAKRSRDSLRMELQDATMESTDYTLYYFNGTEETIVTDALVDEWSVTYAYDKPVMILQIYNQSDVQKVKISEITSSYEVSSLVNAALYSSSERYIVTGATLSVLEQTDATYFMLSSDGGVIYFLDDVSDTGEGDLYKVAVADDTIGKPEMFDSDVSSRSLFFTNKDELGYYKNVDSSDYKGDLYIDGEEIDYDVQLWNISYLDDAVLYYTDWNSEKSYGTLKMFEGGNKTKIADDVHDFDITNNGDILYLYDYSTNYYTGTLYLYNDGEPKKIDDDVVALIPVYNSTIKGEYSYGW